jgi:hypothetical protein
VANEPPVLMDANDTRHLRRTASARRVTGVRRTASPRAQGSPPAPTRTRGVGPIAHSQTARAGRARTQDSLRRPRAREDPIAHRTPAIDRSW